MYSARMSIYNTFKFIAFKTDPETIHDYTMKMFKHLPHTAKVLPRAEVNPKLALSDGHMRWDFPVGLAAGFDKNAQAIEFFSRLGFGAVEVGTVTPRAQIGNDRPRIFRMPEIRSVRNSMGFPNAGAELILKNIQNTKYKNVLGVNLGKNKTTTDQATGDDYDFLYKKFAPVSDYLVINISSPNTPGLRSFQNPESFRLICEKMEDSRKEVKKPLYLKIAPDMEKDDVYDLVDLAKEFDFAGIIATNTTIQHNYGKGGVSGDYIREISKQVRKWCCEAAREKEDLSVIGVGGVKNIKDLIEFWKDGGSFMQVYTAFIYEGPKLLQQMQTDLLEHLSLSGANTLQEWVDELKTTR
jgi:dihydroorotate dehydrogenase